MPDLFTLVAAVVSLAAFFSYLNRRFLGIPPTIGVMAISLLFSASLVALERLGVPLEGAATRVIEGIDFRGFVLDGALGFLLFAGALHVDLDDLRQEGGSILALATVGVFLSTLLVGSLFWAVSAVFDLGVPFAFCLVFGALVSPTDPVAVLGILRSAGVPRRLETRIAGESLFNDGVGVVLFLVLLRWATSPEPPAFLDALFVFGRETGGGLALGLGTGLVAFALLRSIDDYRVEVLGSLALVMGTYALATHFHLSGPIAVVVAGLLVGNQGRRFAMSETTRERLDSFWELVDEILNAVLFVLIGLEVLVLPFSEERVFAGLAAIVVVFLARAASVSAALRLVGSPGLGGSAVLTWAGLRGGIAVALALALPRGPVREVLVPVTYAVVLFSILVQGLTVRWVVERVARIPATPRERRPRPPAAEEVDSREEELEASELEPAGTPDDEEWTI